METIQYGYGIDPGWINLGLAIVHKNEEDWRVTIDHCSTYNPSTAPLEFAAGITQIALKELPLPFSSYSLNHVVIERYVPYAGTYTAEAENINMLIGMICQEFYRASCLGEKPLFPSLLRAVEWKTSFVKYLNKNYGFNNPSPSLDKKFSIAAAKFLVTNPEMIKTDHEADAVCLAAIPFLLKSK